MPVEHHRPGGFTWASFASPVPAPSGRPSGVKPGTLGPSRSGASTLRIEDIIEPELSGGLAEEIAEAIFAEWIDEKVNALKAGIVAGSGAPVAQGA